MLFNFLIENALTCNLLIVNNFYHDALSFPHGGSDPQLINRDNAKLFRVCLVDRKSSPRIAINIHTE